MPVGTRTTSTPLSNHETSTSSSRNPHKQQRDGSTKMATARGEKRRDSQSKINPQPTKRSVRIEEPPNESRLAEETALLRAKVVALEEQIDARSRKEALKFAAADRAKQAEKIAVKERRQAKARETLGFEVQIRTPRTSEIGQEDADLRSRLAELGGEEAETDEYDIALTASLAVNKRNKGRKIFPTQKRNDFDLCDLEQWIHNEMESGAHTAAFILESHEYEIQRRRVYA